MKTPAIQFQVHITGPGLHRLKANAARQLVERALDREHIHPRIAVRIMAWRDGKELDWKTDHPKAHTLRETIRRALHDGRMDLSTVRRPRKALR